MPRGASLKSGLLVAGSFALAIAAGAVLVESQSLMGQGFEKALSNPRSELSFGTTVPAIDRSAGDEGYWLTRAEMQNPAVVGKPMVVGDRITITGPDGHERKLEVTDVKAIGTASRANAVSLLLVTCRVTQDGAEAALVRFIMEGQLPKAPASPASPKTL